MPLSSTGHRFGQPEVQVNMVNDILYSYSNNHVGNKVETFEWFDKDHIMINKNELLNRKKVYIVSIF